MERRKFIRNSFIISGGILAAPTILAQSSLKRSTKKVTILHTNDTHSNIEPFPDNHSKHPGQGGVSRRFELINQIRATEENVLLLDAGDIFQGTPYFNRYGGVLEMKLMSILGYDAATMGNHDFDGGMEGFVTAKQFGDFPFLCSNYDFTNTPIDGHTQKSTIITKGGIKIGVFGIGVELKGLVPGRLYGESKWLDPIEIATDRAAELKAQGCDIVICLSHLGYEYSSTKVSDRLLAQKTRNIHFIIGGHTHTFLNEPTQERNLDGELVLINQVGWAGINLGRIDVEIDAKPRSTHSVIEVR